MDGYIWISGNNLLLRRQLRALLELEVTNRAGQGQIAIDTPKVDKSSRSTYTSFLAWK
jgi:hypothetical protein